MKVISTRTWVFGYWCLLCILFLVGREWLKGCLPLGLLAVHAQDAGADTTFTVDPCHTWGVPLLDEVAAWGAFISGVAFVISLAIDLYQGTRRLLDRMKRARVVRSGTQRLR